MLVIAETQLKHTQKCAKAASALHLVEYEKQRLAVSIDAPTKVTSEGKKALKIADILEDLDDDIQFVGGLRELWCVEEESGKRDDLQATGVRDGKRPHLL